MATNNWPTFQDLSSQYNDMVKKKNNNSVDSGFSKSVGTGFAGDPGFSLSGSSTSTVDPGFSIGAPKTSQIGAGTSQSNVGAWNNALTKVGGSGGTDKDIASQIAALVATQKAAQQGSLQSNLDTALGNLQTGYNTSLADLETQRGNIKNSYYNQRNTAAGQSDVGAMNYAQAAAANGIRGSAAMQPELYRNVALQGALNNLNTAESQAYADLDTQAVTLQSNYNANVAALQNAYLSDMNAANANLDASGISAKIAALQDAQSKARAQADTDKSDWTNTIGQYSDNYQAEINRIDSLITSGQSVDSDGISLAYKKSVLTAARQEKINNQASAQASANQQDFENQLALARLQVTQQNASNSGSRSSGSSGSSTGQLTYSQLNSVLNSMYGRYAIGDTLTPEGQTAMYNYIVQYGGQYAPQLMATYGLSAPTASSSSTTAGRSPNYNGVVRQAQIYLSFGGTGAQNDAITYIGNAISNGNITRPEAVQIMRSLGLA
ncbi:hypothetical protein SAMN02745823_02720 [Sporobacter termitidis DSM 10068]|uniref:Uncharacterized protein n=1 Tax=Sporobacter termitidis DSM 10068 TaxID=1123282 RepID=A0A1M5YNL5_9FIRM|nr:hypothetical protein [Sporobacter termitidis]SHI13697.1 hypothetical protein SAMN02745823_02720 [Sporobacter termitidis DSM 10068]